MRCLSFFSWLLIAVVAAAPVDAQQVNAFPERDDPLHVKVEMFDELLRGNQWNEGIFMQHVVYPPAGHERPIVGSQEDAIECTAAMLAAYSYRYAVTGEPHVREWCEKIIDGYLKLERVTGVEGWFARSFNRTGERLWHMDAYFFPRKWRESESMPGYYWLGDVSSDKFTDLCYSIGIFYDLAAEGEYKEIAADFLERVVGRVVDQDYRLVDIDGKMTLWGNFSPYLPRQRLNSMQMLAALKTAHRVSKNPRFRRAYHYLIDHHNYDDDTVMAKRFWTEDRTHLHWGRNVPWDDKLASKALYQLLKHEDDGALRNKYLMSLHRHWHVWQMSDYERGHDVYYPMFYQVFTGDEVFTEEIQEAMKGRWGFDRNQRTFSIPQEDGETRRVESEEDHGGIETTLLIRDYWFGRYYGLIDPEW